MTNESLTVADKTQKNPNDLLDRNFVERLLMQFRTFEAKNPVWQRAAWQCEDAINYWKYLVRNRIDETTDQDAHK